MKGSLAFKAPVLVMVHKKKTASLQFHNPVQRVCNLGGKREEEVEEEKYFKFTN